MGSIVGVLARDLSIDDLRVREMLAAAPHRGAEYRVRICGSCVLGVSNKNDFIDSTLSRQGELVAAFSGKLDNAADLHKLLTERGQRPASADVADVVVSAFRVFGPDAPNRMRGVFAGIVSDGRQMWCFRDHLGFKSLYYRDEARAFFVATEAKQIIVGAGLRREPNLAAIDHLLFANGTDDKPCALQGVNHVRQASVYEVGLDSAVQSHRYWHPENLLETVRLTSDEVRERFGELFRQAVTRCLTGEDVLSLSGGLDSASIAAVAAPEYAKVRGGPLGALSAVFPDLPNVDESRYIQMIVEYLGLDLHTYRIQAPMLKDVQHWCNLLDGPVYTMSIPDLYENYTLARELGYRNVLTGDIAEFVIGFRAHIIGHLLMHGRWKALGRLIATELHQGRSRRAIAHELLIPFIPGSIANWYLRARRPDPRQWIPDWVDHAKIKSGPYRPDLLPPAHVRWSEQQLAAFKGTALLDESLDLCADLSGVTVRRPFADIDLWEFFLSLPAETKIPDLRLKTLMRSLMRGKLPDEILDRPRKTTFNDHLTSRIDYPSLRKYLVNPSHRIGGIDYQRLAARIEREEMNMFDWMWANTLTRVHAFLSLW
jgi:asparagine synthase (glutamine-hydrolysing)